MYLWKCWYDSRRRFLALLVFGVGLVLTYIAISKQVKGPAFGIIPANPAVQAEIWHDLLLIDRPATMLACLAAIILGAGVLADEFTNGSMESLLTLPRRRRYFVWTSWATALIESFAVATVTVLGGMSSAVYISRTADYRIIMLIVLMIPLLGILCGLTSFLSLVLKSGRNGLVSALGLILLYNIVIGLIGVKWQVWTPWWWFDNLTGLVSVPSSPSNMLAHNPTLAIVGWMCFALLFPLASQLLMRQRDI